MKFSPHSFIYKPFAPYWNCPFSEQQKNLCKSGFIVQSSKIYLSALSSGLPFNVHYLNKEGNVFKLNRNLKPPILWEK